MKKKSTKARLAELAEIIETAKREAGEAQARVAQAQSEQYSIEREIARNQKPTPRMMEVLAQMIRDGVKVKRSLYQDSYYTESRDGHTAGIVSSVYYGLRDREALEESPNEHKTYRVTAHGKRLYAKYQK